MKNQEGEDVIKFKSDDEYDFHPYFGTFRKGQVKKGMLSDPDEELPSSVIRRLGFYNIDISCIAICFIG